MADVLAGETYVSREAQPRHDRAAQRVLVAVIVLLSLTLAGELLYHLVLAPHFVVRSINLESDLPISDEELLSIAGLRIGMPSLSIDTDAVAARIKANPIVRDAQVNVTFPGTVTVSASRRVALAAALAESNGQTVPVVFDESGIVFQVGLKDADADLPIVSGLHFETVDLGLQLPSLVVDFLAQLRTIKTNNPDLYRLFSEYRVVQKNDYAYEVVLYPMHFPVPVRIGTSIDADMIQYVIMMLDVLKRDGRLSSLAELDFRSGEGVLRYRTDGSGGVDG